MKRLSVTLLFFTEDKNVGLIGQVLGKEPTRLRIAWDPSTNKPVPEWNWNTSCWQYCLKDVDEKTLVETLAEFSDMANCVQSKGDFSNLRAQIRIGVFGLKSMGDVVFFPPELLKQLAAAGVELSIDMYPEGNESH